ncbi:MAG: 3-deoxy-D-manno-octulosonic acid transferase [Candidatus Omnitrophica bacterium]|nr:3-deoxy-D-manno-octulosonic acid transferase [Candidatus Omnitrophota bacterium]
MFIFYNLIYILAAVAYLPVFLWRGKFHRGFTQRLGFLPKDLELKGRPVWIHAVSVGEVMAVRTLLEELRKTYPGKRFVISTVTPTGNKIARNIAANRDTVIYLPLDLSFIVRGVIEKINPSVFILAETELWPNLVSCLYEKRIPVIVVNARISDASFKKYMAFRFLFKNMLNEIEVFCVQSVRDAERLIRMGVRKDKVRVTGNMKFDLKVSLVLKNAADLKLKLGISPGDKFFVCGSTHPGEEGIILAAYKKLLAVSPALRLLIAPRHPERSAELEKLIRSAGFEATRTSKITVRPNASGDAKTVLILDSVGELLSIYSIADIVFVGGSLVKKGGHNILEPAMLGQPVLFGPYMFNFRDIAQLFLERGAALLVKDTEQLYSGVKYLLDNPYTIPSFAQKAKELLAVNQGATGKNAAIIKEICQNTYTI